MLLPSLQSECSHGCQWGITPDFDAGWLWPAREDRRARCFSWFCMWNLVTDLQQQWLRKWLFHTCLMHSQGNLRILLSGLPSNSHVWGHFNKEQNRTVGVLGYPGLWVALRSCLGASVGWVVQSPGAKESPLRVHCPWPVARGSKIRSPSDLQAWFCGSLPICP